MTKQSLESSPSISGSTGNEPVNCTACELDEFLCNLAEGYLPCVSSELCTSSPALAEGFLPTFYFDTSQCAQSRLMSIASKSYRRGKQTVLFHGFPSLQMSQNLMDGRGEALLMSFAEAFRAKTSAPREGVAESTASDPAFGGKWPASSVKYDRDSSSWKTAHCLWEEVLPWSSVTLPTWGMTRSGFVYRHPTLERPISGTGAGLWQTIVADDSADRAKGKWNSRGEPKLSAQVLHPEYWPTPTVCGNYNRKGASATSGDGLATYVAKFATPQARDFRSGSKSRWDDPARSRNLNDQIATSAESGRLNPDWVEWLMGWPIGHTALKPLETGRYREWLQQHSPCF